MNKLNFCKKVKLQIQNNKFKDLMKKLLNNQDLQFMLSQKVNLNYPM